MINLSDLRVSKDKTMPWIVLHVAYCRAMSETVSANQGGVLPLFGGCLLPTVGSLFSMCGGCLLPIG
jgi:hypothetical protein